VQSRSPGCNHRAVRCSPGSAATVWFRCQVRPGFVILVHVEASNGLATPVIHPPMWGPGPPCILTERFCAGGELAYAVPISKREPDIPFIRLRIWALRANSRVTCYPRDFYLQPQDASGHPRRPDLIVDDPVHWRGAPTSAIVSQAIGAGLIVLWLSVIGLSITSTRWLAKRHRITLESSLSPDECKRRLESRIADEREREWSSPSMWMRIRGDRIRLGYRRRGALQSILIVRFLPILYLLLANPLAPVVFDGRLVKTERGTALDGRFRMNRFAFAVVVYILSVWSVIVASFIVP
jgi:hypothetical protein